MIVKKEPVIDIDIYKEEEPIIEEKPKEEIIPEEIIEEKLPEEEIPEEMLEEKLPEEKIFEEREEEKIDKIFVDKQDKAVQTDDDIDESSSESIYSYSTFNVFN